jgi:DNA polymerase-1
LGRQIRKAFIAPPGNVLLGVDYSQIELRIVAHMSNDEAMIEAFKADQDIHTTTAAAIYDVDVAEVTQGMRRHAKAVNFGLIYGMSPFGLSRTTDLTLAEAEDFVDTYFKRFPGVHDYLAQIRREAAQHGYVETLLGRRRYFPQLGGTDVHVSEQARARAEREAINAPIQGTAADIIKIAMLKLPEAMKEQGLASKMLLQVHDELVLECPKDQLQATVDTVRETMYHAYELCIPLKTDAKAGSNWSQMDALS